jgi:hypothetical protein
METAQCNHQSEIRTPQSSFRIDTMNRREFLLLNRGSGGQSAILSCEQLYMRYVDAQADGTTTQLFEQLARDLQGVASVRLTDTEWLAHEDLKKRIDAVLAVNRS